MLSVVGLSVKNRVRYLRLTNPLTIAWTKMEFFSLINEYTILSPFAIFASRHALDEVFLIKFF